MQALDRKINDWRIAVSSLREKDVYESHHSAMIAFYESLVFYGAGRLLNQIAAITTLLDLSIASAKGGRRRHMMRNKRAYQDTIARLVQVGKISPVSLAIGVA